MTREDHTPQDPQIEGAAAGADPPTEEAPTREQPPTREGSSTQRSGPRRLLRSRDDRVIAGVSGGLGRYFDVDPVIIRIAFAVTVLFGGLGVIAYLAAVLFVPSDDGTGSPVPPQRGRGIVRATGVVLLVIAALFGFGALLTGAAFVTGLGYGLGVAAMIVIIGIALVALSFRGGARWLIVPALALSIGVAVAAAADLDLDGGIGNREYRPASASAIPADGYELGVGRLAVDLRGIDWAPSRNVDLDVRVGAGELLVAVPTDVCVVADAHAGAGDLRVAGQRADGLDVDLVTGEGSNATPQLRLDADVDVGEIRVLNEDHADIGADGGRGPFGDHQGPFGDDGPSVSDAVARDANAAACAA